MNRLKLISWMMTQTFPLYCAYDRDGVLGGWTYTTPEPGTDLLFPDVYTATHEVARKNWIEYIDSFPEFNEPEPPRSVSLQESLGLSDVALITDKPPTRVKRKK